MTTADWIALVPIILSILVGIWRTGVRAGKIDSKIDGTNQNFESKIDETNRKIDSTDKRIDTVASDLREHMRKEEIRAAAEDRRHNDLMNLLIRMLGGHNG